MWYPTDIPRPCRGELRLAEAQAANAYIDAWRGMPVTFQKPANGCVDVPARWLRFEKARDGAKVAKRYEKPATSYQRVMGSPFVAQERRTLFFFQ